MTCLQKMQAGGRGNKASLQTTKFTPRSSTGPGHRPKVKWKEVERIILSTSKDDHQLVTSKGDNVYQGMTIWLKKGCSLKFSGVASEPPHQGISY